MVEEDGTTSEGDAKQFFFFFTRGAAWRFMFSALIKISSTSIIVVKLLMTQSSPSLARERAS